LVSNGYEHQILLRHARQGDKTRKEMKQQKERQGDKGRKRNKATK
jgi:hypothetical protein